MKKSNCLLFAILLYIRLYRRWLRIGKPKEQEPYFVIRFSRLRPEKMPHFLVGIRLNKLGNLRLVSWKPVDKTPLPLLKLHTALRTKGIVEWGDRS